MPVIPTGIPAYQIRPPLTTTTTTGKDKCGGDEPNSSNSTCSDILADTKRIFDLIEDERHLTAHALLVSVQKRIKEYQEHQQQEQQQQQDTKNNKGMMILPAGLSRHLAKLTSSSSHNHQYHSGNNSSSNMDDSSSVCFSITNDQNHQQHQFTAALEILQSRNEQITKLENRSRLFKRARSSIKNSHDDDTWTLGSTLFGISTFYHREENDHSLSIKLQGELKDVPLFEQVCVLREVDLHYKWAPFCSSSMTVAELDKLDMVGWFLIGLQKFGLARDGCFRVVGCDHTLEDGSFLLTGHGIQDTHHHVAPSTPSSALSAAAAALPSASRPPLFKHSSSSNINDKKDKKINTSSDKEPNKHGNSSSNISDKKDKKNSSSENDAHHVPSPSAAAAQLMPPSNQNINNSSDKKDKKNSSENGNNDDSNDSSSSSSSDEKHDTITSDDYDFLSQDELLKQLPIPPVPTRRGAGRMTIRRFDAMITVTSPTSASIIVIANVDPNISYFHSVLLEFVMKHLAGVVLFQLQGAAKRAVKHPVTNEHAKRMRSEEAFYKHWLLPKFQAVCVERGWEMPPVAAFELTPNQLRKENNTTRNNQQQQRLQQKKKGPLAVTTEPDLQQEQKHHAAATTTRRAVTFYEGSAVDVNDDTDNDDNFDYQQPKKGFITRRRTKSFDLSMRQAEEEEAGNQQQGNHHHHDHDLISELSSRSGHHTPWPQLHHALAKGGPVGRFIRQQEIKQVRNQENKVEQARQKISNMLKPKELDEQQMKRLQQLKLAKARRLAEEQGIYDLSSASFLLSPLQRSDSAPSLTELVASHIDSELPKRATSTTTRGMALSSLALPAATPSRRLLPLGLDDTGTMSTVETSTVQAMHVVPSLPHPPKQERRQQQASQHSAAPSIFYVPNQRQRRSFLRFVTDRLYTHGRTKKVLVVSLMVALLFVSLHPRLLLLRMKPPKFLETYNESADQQRQCWWEAAACLCLDVATSLYLCACAILHFFLCDISLVYAFDSLELGAKTGRQVRKFYIDNVRLPVAMTSFGIVALSIIKALSRLGLRALLWFLLVSYNAATGRSSTLIKVLPGVVGDYWNMALPLWTRACLVLQGAVRVCLAIPFNFVLQHAVRSNWLGRSAEAQLLLLFNQATTSARGAIDAFEGKIEVAPWRMEAFETARTMFAYTAVFLVTALLLFSISASQKRRAAKTVRIDSRIFKDDISIRTGIKEESTHPPPGVVSSSPATTASLKEDIIRKKDDDDKNNIARLESSLHSFGVSQHDEESLGSPESSHNNSNSSSSDNKARGVLRFRKKWSDPLHESFPLVLGGGKVRRRKTTL